MNTSGIYTITSHKTSKVYVGSSVRTAHRWRVHQRDLRKGVHPNLHLQRHVDKYGLEDLVFEVVRVESNPARRLGFEELLIAGLFGPACFNQAMSAKAPMTGRKHSPETLAKMSATAKGRPFPEGAHAKSLATNTGRTLTPEHLAKMSAGLKGKGLGRHHTAEAKAKMSAGNLGKTHTPETKAKMSAALKGKGLGVALTPEHAAKARVAFKGRIHTPETKAKMSAAHKLRLGSRAIKPPITTV